MFTQIFFLVFSLLLTFLFFLYGFNHYYLLRAARRYRLPPLPPEASRLRPPVSIHLPIYNEKYVVRRLVMACRRMAEEYGTEKVTITLIDDSTDDTRGVVDELVAAGQQQGLRIEVLRRDHRAGYKAGALQLALERTEDEFIAVFDADYTPPPDFLVRTMPYFAQDAGLAIIQSRWTYLNRSYNLVTRAVAIGIDVHFLIEQAGRFAANCFQNFNGSGGVLRKKAVEAAGGWQADTLAEDLDVSYRIQLKGYRVLYLKDVHSPGEIPPTVPSFKKQQARWANGSLRTARKVLPALLQNRALGLKQRLEAFIHLTGYIIHPLMFISFLLACFATLFRADSLLVHIYWPSSFSPQVDALSVAAGVGQAATWGVLVLLILLCMVATWVTPVAALKAQHIPVSHNLTSLLVLFLLGAGISLSNTIEAGKALFSNRNWEFKRTPKYAVLHSAEAWHTRRYQVPLDFVCFLELASVCLGGLAIGSAVWHSDLAILLILVPYTAAYAFVALFTIGQSRPPGGG
jgi:cellulose synthase/poly-beta-1,6-N-acetylglucosamine synthase-like glycosyltransferase